MEEKRSSNLKEVLLSFKPDAPDFGEKTPDARRVKTDGADQLRRDLQRVSAANKNYFSICVGLLLVLFAGAFVLVVRSLDKPAEIAGIFGATGISLLGIVTQMARLWRQKVNTDMMLVLASNMRPADFKAVVEIVLRSYLK
jgi:multisubunit Na+/H+ antiporter MnhF subunit